MRKTVKKMVMLCLASAVMSFEMAAGAYADTEGPGAGLSETRNTTISHGSPQNAGAAFENMTAVELDVSIAEITGNVEIAIAAAPGSPESYGLAYPKTIYRVTGDGGNGWIQIAYDGHFAYLDGNSGQVTVKNTWNIPTADESRADMIKQAMNLLGSRYQMGGVDPASGFDCSGFVGYLMKNTCGIQLPRTSREQACQGMDRTAESLRTGDLIAFGSSLNAVSHIGVYIGDNRMIHGDGTGKGVTICVWNDRSDIIRLANVLGD